MIIGTARRGLANAAKSERSACLDHEAGGDDRADMGMETAIDGSRSQKEKINREYALYGAKRWWPSWVVWVELKIRRRLRWERVVN